MDSHTEMKIQLDNRLTMALLDNEMGACCRIPRKLNITRLVHAHRCPSRAIA